MRIKVLKSKIHSASVTEANLDYEGSLTLNRQLMEMAGLALHEYVEVYNISNGERLSTYLISSEKQGMDVCANGAAAWRIKVGHKIIIASYAWIDEKELASFKPKIVLLGEKNRVLSCS